MYEDMHTSDELDAIKKFEEEKSREKDSEEPEFDGIVYQPEDDTYLLCDASDEFAFGNVLEVGCGSGFISVEMAKNGLNVTACDINPHAVIQTKKLAECENVKVNVLESDLFESVVDTYDTIVFNPPYLPEDKREPKGMMKVATTGGESGYELIERFFHEVPHYINKKGIILLLFSSLTDKDKVDEIISLHGYKLEIVREKQIFFETLYVYKIQRL